MDLATAMHYWYEYFLNLYQDEELAAIAAAVQIDLMLTNQEPEC